MNERNDHWTWLSGFFAGGIAGAGVMLLLAPRSGQDTRGRVGRKLRRAARAARQLRNRDLMDRESALAGNGGGQATPVDAGTPSG